MRINVLNKKEKKEFEEKLKERFGIILPRCSLVRGGKDKIRIFTGDFSEHELNILNGIARVETIGMYFAQYIDKIRIGFSSSNLFKATKNILELKKQEAEKWLRGEDLNIKYKNKGYILLKFDSMIIGCGKATEEMVLNFVPKEKRIF